MRTTKPIIALDVSSKEEAMDFLNHFDQESLYLKVGMELYYSEGPQLIHELKARGHQLFLDLKLHDIPHTVYSAMKVLAKLDVDMVNVHAAGGKEMMKAALKGLEEGTQSDKKRPLLIAVTQLTSTSEEQMQTEQLVLETLDNSVANYAKLAQEAGLDGVVCSAFEVRKIHAATNKDFLCVTPGIRPDGSEAGDQQRIATPAFARKTEASHIVVGRPIINAAEPVIAYQRITQEWRGE